MSSNTNIHSLIKQPHLDFQHSGQDEQVLNINRFKLIQVLTFYRLHPAKGNIIQLDLQVAVIMQSRFYCFGPIIVNSVLDCVSKDTMCR